MVTGLALVSGAIKSWQDRKVPMAWMAKDTVTTTPTRTFTSSLTSTFTSITPPTRTYISSASETLTPSKTLTATSTPTSTSRPYSLITVYFTNNSYIVVYVMFETYIPIQVDPGKSTVISAYLFHGRADFAITVDYGTNNWRRIKTVEINVQGPQTIEISYP
jgi:hypothetical protein